MDDTERGASALRLRDLLIAKLHPFANDVWARFGGDGVAVYLVGSALEDEAPRDCDISIVLPPTYFARRYGSLEGDWRSWTPPPYPVAAPVPLHPGLVRMMREVGKLTHRAAVCLDGLLPPDVKIMSGYEALENHANQPKVRLDSFARYDYRAYRGHGGVPEWATDEAKAHQQGGNSIANPTIG